VKQNSRIHIGTSGWHYDHWLGPFYPEHTAKSDFLTFYQQYFHTVEINNSFYHLPAEKTLGNWRDRAPHGFVFAVKASRYITHMKKLKAPEQSIKLFFDRVTILEAGWGPSFSTAPHWHCNPERLQEFFGTSRPDFVTPFEFRDQSWHNPKSINY
jgi:uncharacterized protein YecE (DUF72 family)